MKHLCFIFAVLIAFGCQSTSKPETTAPAEAAKAPALPTTLEEAINSGYRTPKNKERDQYRHPQETLTFFGLKPEMTVIEISPGAGWYMEILAPLLSQKGKYIAALPESDNEYMIQLNEKVASWLKNYPELDAKVVRATFSPPDKINLGSDGQADMVLTFRNVHNWMSKKGEQAAFDAFFKALKPGGILGVVEHRANPKTKKDPEAKSGYVHESEVIRLAKKAGFKLEAKSEINANPKDTKDHPEGVWTLPPSYKLGDKDKEKYAAIGESDRMTLRFVKPNKTAKKK